MPDIFDMKILLHKLRENLRGLEQESNLHCKCLQGITGTLQGNSALSMEKGCKHHRETYTPQRERLRITLIV